MRAERLIKEYLDFFHKRKKHAIIPSAPLIPENDPSTLFNTAGMQPLVPYLLGQSHPKGKRLVDVQKCIRTPDIDDVGDNTHLTFFEMLGNWSLGDYFKKESITWSYELLTQVLGIDTGKIYVTVFAGDETAPRDEESAKVWSLLGVPKNRIYYLPYEDNWWGLETGPCGPCTEIFIDSGRKPCKKTCKPGCGCGKYFEIWNNVFMEYNKTKEGKYEPLVQKNVDTGMGVERTIAMLLGKQSVYDTHLFQPLIELLKKNSNDYNEKSARIISDHVRAATFILGDERGVTPGKSGQGYVLRRLIRRAIRHCKLINAPTSVCADISKLVVGMYEKRYSSLKEKADFIMKELNKEVEVFEKTLEKGLNVFGRLAHKDLTGEEAFLLYQSYGFPIEMTKELSDEKGIKVDVQGFQAEFEKHQEVSKKGAGKKFKGGLADTSNETVKLHTATHLLNEALRRVLGGKVKQKGSNITSERLRFDFNFDRKLTQEELKKVEDLVNEQIRKNIPVKKEEMSFEKAKSLGSQAEFEAKYDDKVFVYSINDFSKEVCAGPHVENTKELGHFKIKKEEGIAAGVRRIRAVLE